MCFVESIENDYDITMPYDHVEYSIYTGERFVNPKYYHDKDGYDFINGEFS